jgi:hypothetical protein
MEHPSISDGGNGLTIWKAAANVFSKQSWTADGGGPAASGLGGGLTAIFTLKIGMLWNVMQGRSDDMKEKIQ